MTPVYEESLDPRPDTKGVVMVITTRQGGREGCFWPLTSLLSLFLERVLTPTRRFQDVARSARKADQFRGKKGTKRDREGTRYTERQGVDRQGKEDRGEKIAEETMRRRNSTETKLRMGILIKKG